MNTIFINAETTNSSLSSKIVNNNGEPDKLDNFIAQIGNHSIVQISHCRWCCGSLVTRCTLLLLLSMTYQLLLSTMYHYYCLWRIKFKAFWGNNDCTDLWVIEPKSQVAPSSGFRVPHYWFTTLTNMSNVSFCRQWYLSMSLEIAPLVILSGVWALVSEPDAPLLALDADVGEAGYSLVEPRERLGPKLWAHLPHHH